MSPPPYRSRRADLLQALLALVVAAAIGLQGFAIYQLRQDVDLAFEALYLLYSENGWLEDEGADAKPYGHGEDGELYL